MNWTPPEKMTKLEKKISERTKKGKKIFVFLREHRQRIITEEFEQKLIETYEGVGREAALPGQLAIATLLQAYCGVSDKETVELTVMDKRWQMVLNCLNCEEPPFSQRTLASFRERLIANNLDKELLDMTVALAEEYGGFGPRQLRATLDSSPLLGKARVEDTFNLLGHALTKAVKIAAKKIGKEVEEVLEEGGLLLIGRSSLKAALDLDWGLPQAKKLALDEILQELDRWKIWVAGQSKLALDKPPLKESMDLINKILEQDTEPDPDGSGRKLKKGVAKDRLISVEDKEMRHGRKSSNKPFNGFKQHLLADMDSRVVREVVVLPANQPESDAVDFFMPEFKKFTELKELYIDLGYASHPMIQKWQEKGVNVVSRPWSSRETGFFSKQNFVFDFKNNTITCPAGKKIKLRLGKDLCFSSSICFSCPIKSRCLSGNKKWKGRTLRVREDEFFQDQKRKKMKTPQGRAEIRKRALVEHRISHQVKSQGRKAQYLGSRKNQFDGRCHAAILNLHLALQYWESQKKQTTA